LVGLSIKDYYKDFLEASIHGYYDGAIKITFSMKIVELIVFVTIPGDHFSFSFFSLSLSLSSLCVAQAVSVGLQ
jgi:hypothetical protein